MGGAILGSLTPHDYFGKLSFSSLLSLNAILFVLLATANILDFSPLVGVVCLAFVMYLMSKSMPKLDTLLLSNLSADVLARSNNLLSMIFSLTLPLGMSVFSFFSFARYQALLVGIFGSECDRVDFITRKKKFFG